MNVQNGGPNEASEAGSAPDTGSKPMGSDAPLAGGEAMSAAHIGGEPVEAPVDHAAAPAVTEGEAHAEPVIDSEAVEPSPPETPAESLAETEAAETEEEQEEIAAPPKPEPPRSNKSLMVAAGVVLLGAAGYLGWSQFVAEPEAPAPVVAPAPGVSPTVLPPRHAEVRPGDDRSGMAPTPAPAESPKAEHGSASPPPASPATRPSPEIDAAKTSAAETTLAAKLAATQAALERATQRLQALEGQAAAPKSDARAPNEVGMARAGDASARIVVAQSLLTALRQGDDFTPQVTALQGFDGDSPRILSLRAALNSPSAAKLAADFATLEPKLAKAAAPPSEAARSDGLKSDAPAAKPESFGKTVLAFVEARVEKLVKISPADAPDNEQTGERIKRIEQKLLRGDIAGALAERSLLPEPAVLLSADWAKGAQQRLDAEMAAKAELSEAMEAFGKNKS